MAGNSIKLLLKRAARAVEFLVPRSDQANDQRASAAEFGGREYSPDKPIEAPAEDSLGRFPFVQRVAETIKTRSDPSGLVIAINGPWGDGKTSALNLLAGELKHCKDIVTVRFNPWLFSSEADLTRSFFATLADVLGRQLGSNTEKLEKVLEKCSPIASLVSVSAAGGALTLDPGGGMKELGKQLSNRTIDQSRKQFEEILREEAKTIVVFVDDLDRLDRNELHSMLRMVKLTAGFDRVVYVLAFDNEVVAEAIGHGGLLSLSSEVAVKTVACLARHQKSAGLLIDKLQSVDEEALSNTGSNLIFAIAENSLLFPDVDGILGMHTIRSRACRLLARLVGMLGATDSDAAVERAVDLANPPYSA